ncbi:MAG: hypothetical protein RL328_2586 [Acidobacteriota bacterium]|jgi:GT2 family glycosyltransferase
MSVAAVIPHWNRVELLRGLLENLRAQTRAFDRVIVVDNGSTDGSAAIAEQMGAEVVRLPSNVGFAAAVNRGIAAAGDCEWVAILNNDVTLRPEWLARLLGSVGDAAFATGKILSAQDHSVIDGTWDEISRGGCAYRMGAGSKDGPAWGERRRIRMASMTACLVRRSVFERVGQLDERFGSYLEDVDFGLRCVTYGLSGIYEPEAVAYHLGSSTLGRWHSDTVRLIARNQKLLVAKHFSGQAGWPIVAGQLLWGLVALRHGCGSAWLRGRKAGRLLAREIKGARQIAGLGKALAESEREILASQQRSGWDNYWRVYAWLAPLR